MSLYKLLNDNYTDSISGAHFLLEEGHTVVGTTGAMFGAAFAFGTVTDSSLSVQGVVDGQTSEGVVFDLTGSHNFLRVAASGVVQGISIGVDMWGGDSRTVNLGLISAAADDGIGLTATDDGNEVVNKGTILASGASAAGVSFLSRHGAVHNDGLIRGGHNGVELLGATGALLDNSGRIVAGNSGVVVTGMSSSDATIVNTGRIVGSAVGVAMLGDDGYLENSGVIKTRATETPWLGPQAAVSGGDGVQEIVNSGRIVGDVILGDGNDTYYAQKGGLVTGVIIGGDGQDVLFGARRADRMLGGSGDDLLDGKGGADELDGGIGNDTMNGGRGADRMFGDTGNDFLAGGGGDDVLRGSTDNDLLSGGAGDDVLAGGDDNDLLFGGGGDDKLRGGAGADDFVYQFGIDDYGTDRIVDFQDGIDKIDLSAYALNYANFAAAAVSSRHGNAVIDLSYLNPSDLSQYSGTIVVVGQAGNIDALDFV